MRIIDRIGNEAYAADPQGYLNGTYANRESDIRRMEAAMNIARRYISNISRRVGSDGEYLSNADYDRRFGRNVYMRGALGSAK